MNNNSNKIDKFINLLMFKTQSITLKIKLSFSYQNNKSNREMKAFIVEVMEVMVNKH